MMLLLLLSVVGFMPYILAHCLSLSEHSWHHLLADLAQSPLPSYILQR